EPEVRAAEKRDGGRLDRPRAPPLRCRRHGHPAPDVAAGEAEAVEPGRLVLLEPRRQDLPLPGRRGDLEPLQLGEDPRPALPPRPPLEDEKKTEEGGGRPALPPPP